MLIIRRPRHIRTEITVPDGESVNGQRAAASVSGANNASGRSGRSNLRWVVCGLLFLATTINYMDRSALGLVEPILRHVLGGDLHPDLYNRQYSDIVICFIAAYGIGLLITGRIIDRVGAKVGYALSITLWGLASISHIFARSVVAFGAARFALGLGEAGNFPAALKATADWFPAEERALATGLFNSGTSAASLVAPLLIPWMAVHYGWQSAFLTTGSLSMIWLAGWLIFPYNRLRKKYGVAAVESQKKEKPPESAPRLSMKFLLKKRGTWNFAFSKFMTDPVWWLYLFWLPKFFNERFHVNMLGMGLPLIVVYIGSTVGSIVGGWLAGFLMKRGYSLQTSRRLAMMICAFCATPVVLIPVVHSLWHAIGLLCLATAAHQGFSSNLLSTPSDLFPTSAVGTVVGIGGAVGAVGSTLFTTLVGIVWRKYSLLVFVAGGFAYLITLMAFQWRPPVPMTDEEARAAAVSA
uniref:MFS transporter n=1 Tax=Paracidobacterium acidisoli TaxID=2303751 RepID=A0A372IT14_9BACT